MPIGVVGYRAPAVSQWPRIIDQYQLVKKYYNLNSKGYWEHENYILLRDESDVSYAEKNDLSISDLQSKKKEIDAILLKEREKRIHPGLDDKILTSWNGLMIGALCDAYRVFHDEAFIKEAEKEMHFILDKQLKKDGIKHLLLLRDLEPKQKKPQMLKP